jgi:hypothetical protein
MITARSYTSGMYVNNINITDITFILYGLSQYT